MNTARERVRAVRWTTVEFHAGDARDPDVGDGFDAVVGR
jgi:hypothetical protein